MTETLSFDRELADPHCLSDEQIDALLAGAPWRRFVVVGDSIAAGIRESAPGYRDLSWAERIDEALKRQNADATYLNLGRRGARAHEVRQRQLANALEFRPDLAAVVAGGNDTLAPDCDLDHVEADLEAIITTLQASGADVITFTMLDITKALSFPDDIAALLDELATRSRAIARRHNTIHVDLYDGSFCGDADVYASDYQHASTRGHAICASLTIRGLAERLESTLRNQPQPADV